MTRTLSAHNHPKGIPKGPTRCKGRQSSTEHWYSKPGIASGPWSTSAIIVTSYGLLSQANNWKTSITITLRKTGKDDYTKPKSYWPIALLDTIGKIMESIIAIRISYWVEHYGSHWWQENEGSGTCSASTNGAHPQHHQLKNHN